MNCIRSSCWPLVKNRVTTGLAFFVSLSLQSTVDLSGAHCPRRISQMQWTLWGPDPPSISQNNRASPSVFTPRLCDNSSPAQSFGSKDQGRSRRSKSFRNASWVKVNIANSLRRSCGRNVARKGPPWPATPCAHFPVVL